MRVINVFLCKWKISRLPFEKQSKQMLTGSEAEDVLQTRQAM